MTTRHVFGALARQKTTLIILFTASLSPAMAYADAALPTVMVTANRMATVNAAASTSVITRADIDRLQITSLPELLSRQQGIGIASQGGAGKLNSLFMRGTESDHVLVLVDGVRWQSATSGAAALQHFPVSQIERIEIVRGPRSGLYGAEAIGGVIQIFTRQGGTGFNPTAKLGFGSHGSREASFGLSGGIDSTDYNVSLSHQETDGINAVLNNNPDKDGYQNQSVSANVTHEFSNRFTIGANILYAQGENKFDSCESWPAPPPFSNCTDDSTQQVLSANASFSATKNWDIDLTVGDSRDKSISFKDDVRSSEFNTQHKFASLQNTVSFSDNHTAIVGFDYDKDEVDSTTLFTVISRDNKALFASWLGDFNRYHLGVSARYDDNAQFGGHRTGNAEAGVQITDNLRIVGSIGTGFKAPTFNDLYYPLTWGYQGNPNLSPERSRSAEIGVEGNTNWGQWSLRYYQNDIENLIAIKSDFSTVENVNEAQIRGAEFAIFASVNDWDVSANISLLNPLNKDTDKQLVRRARQMANVSLDRRWDAFSAGVDWKLQGDSYNNAANTQHLSGFAVVDVRARYAFAPAWAVEARLHNLFDKAYFTALDFSGNGYQSLDRSGFISVIYQP